MIVKASSNLVPRTFLTLFKCSIYSLSYRSIGELLVSLPQGLECFSPSGAAAAAAKSLQSCPTLCNLIDSSPPGSAVHGILQARVLEWVPIAFSANSL